MAAAVMTRLALLLLVVTAAACEQRPAFMRAMTPHETYADGLRKAGLHETALGRDWLASADRAVREPAPTKLPVEVTTPFPAAEAKAFGYRISLRRGRVLRVDVTPSGPEPARIFIDLYRIADPATDPPRHVVSAEAGSLALVREIDRDADYVLRIQPELLRSGTFRITQDTTAALTFPVAGRSRSAVLSFFLDPRDGGRRDHHGVDIFAPRDTPVLATTSGVVSSVGTSPLGGNVVWLWDPRRGHSQYYAHLSEQAVTPGQRVNAGDVLGYVGNTGNARSTAPHLHFGIYVRGDGAIDPLPWIADP